MAEDDEGSIAVPLVLDKDVDAIVARVVSNDPKVEWVTGQLIDLGTKKWRPAAVSNDSKRLLHVLPFADVPGHVAERLRLAAEQAVGVHVALHVQALYKPDLLKLLVECDAIVYVVDDVLESRQFKARDVLAAVADIGVALSADVRRDVARTAWERLGTGTNFERGRRLESLLAFVFSQVSGLLVRERNYRTETEEIDIVLQSVRDSVDRAWYRPGVPFILVESKNTAEKADQPVVSTLLTKLQTNRGSSQIALLVSLSGFTSSAEKQELRFSTTDYCVAMIDGDELLKLIDAPDIDEALDEVIRSSLFR